MAIGLRAAENYLTSFFNFPVRFLYRDYPVSTDSAAEFCFVALNRRRNCEQPSVAAGNHLPTEINEPLKIQPARPLINFVADQCNRHLDAGPGFFAKHLENVSVSEPGNRRNDVGLGLLQVMDDHLVDV